MVALEAHAHRKLLLLGHLVGLDHAAVAGSIHADGLLQEDVLAGRYGRGILHRTEYRRRGQEHQIDLAGHHLQESVEADELALRRHVDLVLDLLDRAQRGKAGFDTVGKHVGHGNQPRRSLRHQRIAAGTASAASTADEADADRIAAGGVGAAQWKRRRQLPRRKRT